VNKRRHRSGEGRPQTAGLSPAGRPPCRQEDREIQGSGGHGYRLPTYAAATSRISLPNSICFSLVVRRANDEAAFHPFLVAVASFASSQDKPPSATLESTEHTCEWTQDDHAVFAALLSGLGEPADPRGVWQGKGILIVDVTATESEPKYEVSNAGGFRSKSEAVPFQETCSGTMTKCALRALSGPDSVTHNPTESSLMGKLVSRVRLPCQ